MLTEIVNLYGAQILGTVLLALFGIFGMLAKSMAERFLDTPLKRELAGIAVQFVEQTCKALSGEQKLSAALSALSELLARKKISATEREMRILIEAAVAEFNDVFHKETARSSN